MLNLSISKNHIAEGFVIYIYADCFHCVLLGFLAPTKKKERKKNVVKGLRNVMEKSQICTESGIPISSIKLRIAFFKEGSRKSGQQSHFQI